MNALITAKAFHNYLDAELALPGRIVETTRTKRILIQERELSYRFALHTHPYVGQLVEKLLRGSTALLQDADTEYVPRGVSLPGSVEVALAAGSVLDAPAGAKVALLSDVSAIGAGGVAIALKSGMQFRLAAATGVTAIDGARVLLNDGLTNTPAVNAGFNLPQAMSCGVSRDTKIGFAAPTAIRLHDAAQATLPATAEVLLLTGTQLQLANGTPVTLRKSQRRPVLFSEIFGTGNYLPADVVSRPYPVQDLDFSVSGVYSVYNWELFFHVPLTIAMHLSKNQRFADAQRWFHYIFDPTDDSDEPTPARFWKVRPFQSMDVKKVQEILVNLSTGADPQLRDETMQSIEAWRRAPFRPHVVARYRQQSYMYKTVMAYLDNLIAWADSLFRQDTGEAIDEALMLYVLAANILGPRPQAIPQRGTVRPQTYKNLRGDLDTFGNAMRDMEADVPFDLMPFPSDAAGQGDQLATLRSLGKALYFCVPRNDKLLSYWDTVADRLFKIRNSLNFQGIFRQLALFEPPIDPALLARAAAAGLDVNAIVNGINQPLPLVRFGLLVQKAAEICHEVKSLGSSLLSAMEKEDNEALSILRAQHERTLLQMVEQVKYGQLQEAIKSREALELTLAKAVYSYQYYGRLLGKQDSELGVPGIYDEGFEFDAKGLESGNFKVKDPALAVSNVPVDIAPSDSGSTSSATLGLIGAGDITGGKKLNLQEAAELDKLELAQASQDVGQVLNLIAKGLIVIPEFDVKFHFWGLGGSIGFGGQSLAKGAELGAAEAGAISGRMTYEAKRSEKLGGYGNRERDWAYQGNVLAAEINQIFKQLRAAQIKEAVAGRELDNHREQIKQAQEIEYFFTGEKNPQWRQPLDRKTKKAVSRDFHAWMKREIKGLYAQCFQFAFDVAKKAERALQHELGDPGLEYLQFGYLSGKEGLLAGEKLYFDVKRMELAFHEQNRREYELTKHVSLQQIDPLALLQLRSTGRCRVSLPEELFDMDGPGHYFRRIKSVAVSVPCVTGPYVGVNCTLTLLKSSIRKTPVLRDGVYGRADAEDPRFNDYFGSLQSVVTSTGQNDSGLFETNLRDERYLPFEGSGVISDWQLELPEELRQFDYNTISDVILHIRYTAREGGGLLRKNAVSHLREQIAGAKQVGTLRLFSMRHEFPTEWAKFKAIKLQGAQLAPFSATLREEHYPFWSRGRLRQVRRVDLFARDPQGALEVRYAPDEQNARATLTKGADFGEIFAGQLPDLKLKQPDGSVAAVPTGELSLQLKDNSMSDLLLAVAWAEEE